MFLAVRDDNGEWARKIGAVLWRGDIAINGHDARRLAGEACAVIRGPLLVFLSPFSNIVMVTTS